MNIFYYSVHHILEDDEVRLFQSLGHSVFCLGINRKGGTDSPYRPAIDFSDHENCIYEIYESMGGRYSAAENREEHLPTGFLEHFSLSVIMHDPSFIIDHWEKLSVRPVIWRTIGQGVDHWEEKLRPFRERGLKIVRYSSTELDIAGSLGQEAIIRFCKRPSYYQGWTGEDRSALTFANYFADRYPNEAEDYRLLAKTLPLKLGGNGNENFANHIGFLDSEVQLEFYQKARVYLYSTGLHIPYTLNFIEAWMTGTPLVVIAPYDRCEKFFEIDKLVVDGRSGFICRSLTEARARIELLLSDKSLAADLSDGGRKSATALFGSEHIGKQWQDLLTKTGLYQ